MLRVELVGSGPASVEATLRRIDRVLLELIREARSELWVVCFAVNNVPEILEALRDAAERDVELNLVLESADESQGRLSFDQIDEIVGMLDQRANVYLWPTERRPCDAQGRRGVLHAKCAVADRQKVLISSANLTEYAMTLNIELGVRVISASAGNQLVRHLKSLNASGILVRTERRL
jgi:phosphatidylserine/phosphatidylglycerophosphate/cardiolipin synthase-like enzyme